MGVSLKYYYQIIRKFIEDYSNPIFRKIKGKNAAINIWRFGKKNPDKIIYFITDVSSEGSGIFSMYLSIIEQISIAQFMGWTPVIDDTPALFRRNKHKFRKKDNVMNEIFQFNNEIETQEVFKSSNVIISRVTDLRFLDNIKGKNMIIKKNSFFDYTCNELQYWINLSKEKLQYKREIQVELEKSYNEIIGTRKNVLGVAVREGKMGMSSKGLSASGENKQPLIEDVIKNTKMYLDKWKCTYIYLSCETERIIEKFEEIFGQEALLVLPRIRMDYEYVISTESMKEGIKKDSKNSELQNNYKKYDLDYVKDMYILSKCTYCIMPKNCGTEVAFLKNEHLIDYYIMEG